MDSSKEQPKTTAGLDLGDGYSYLCLIDQHSGEIVEEGRVRTTPGGPKATLRLRAASYAHRHRNGHPFALG